MSSNLTYWDYSDKILSFISLFSNVTTNITKVMETGIKNTKIENFIGVNTFGNIEKFFLYFLLTIIFVIFLCFMIFKMLSKLMDMAFIWICWKIKDTTKKIWEYGLPIVICYTMLRLIEFYLISIINYTTTKNTL